MQAIKRRTPMPRTARPKSAARRTAAAAVVMLAALLTLAFAGTAHATVTTVFTCPSSGLEGNHDSVFNGFFVSGINANNLNSVQLFYTTDTDGDYTFSLTATAGSFSGAPVGSTVTQTVHLSSTSETAVTWNFGGASYTQGATLFFQHNVISAEGSLDFNLQPTVCNGDEETVGTSTTPNGFSVATTITSITTSGGGSACTANATTLCIDNVTGDKRFKITASFATTEDGGTSGSGHAIPLASLGVSEGGLFWFFAANNPEMLIKVINGCSLGNHFWVFYAATTNVGFTVTVTDTQTNHSVQYKNPDLTAAAPVQDTSALVCP
jgi:hypothetical protein